MVVDLLQELMMVADLPHEAAIMITDFEIIKVDLSLNQEVDQKSYRQQVNSLLQTLSSDAVFQIIFTDLIRFSSS